MLVEGEQGRLTERGYEQIRRACRTYREELVVRLSGEAGLRAGEITRIRPADLATDGWEQQTQYFLTVREADGGTRTAYLPTELAHDFTQYVNSNTISDEDTVIDVTERRVQMLVDEVSDRAAAETGRAVLETVTPTMLRQFFAQQLLVSDGIDIRVVMEIGGWESLDGLIKSIPAPSETEIAASFERVEGDETADSGRIPRIVETVKDTATELLDATSRSALEQAACEQLTTDCYPAAWVLTPDRNRDRLTVRAHAGESENRFEGAADSGIARRALQTGCSFVGPDDPGPASDLTGTGLLAAVPISHDETEHGVLVVRAGTEDAFDDPERYLLDMIGKQLCFAITAAERKQVLTGDSVLEVTVSYESNEAALVNLASSLGCTLELDGAVTSEEGFLCFLQVDGTSPKKALETASNQQGIQNPRLIHSGEDGGLLEVELVDHSPLLFVANCGGTVADFTVESRQAMLTCELAPDTDLRAIHDKLHDQFGIELRSKRERVPTADSTAAPQLLDQQLTERQRDVIRSAYHAGYFEWPRGSTAEDLAESMGVSSPTLHNHLRRAQQNILEQILDN